MFSTCSAIFNDSAFSCVAASCATDILDQLIKTARKKERSYWRWIIDCYFLPPCASKRGEAIRKPQWVGSNRLPLLFDSRNVCAHRWVIVDILKAVILHTIATRSLRSGVSSIFHTKTELDEAKKSWRGIPRGILLLNSVHQREQKSTKIFLGAFLIALGVEEQSPRLKFLSSLEFIALKSETSFTLSSIFELSTFVQIS